MLTVRSSCHPFCVAWGWVLLIPPEEWAITCWHQFVWDGVGSSESIVSSEDQSKAVRLQVLKGLMVLKPERIPSRKKEGGGEYTYFEQEFYKIFLWFMAVLRASSKILKTRHA